MNLIYLTMVLHGIGSLLSWNVFMTAKEVYYFWLAGILDWNSKNQNILLHEFIRCSWHFGRKTSEIFCSAKSTSFSKKCRVLREKCWGSGNIQSIFKFWFKWMLGVSFSKSNLLSIIAELKKKMQSFKEKILRFRKIFKGNSELWFYWMVGSRPKKKGRFVAIFPFIENR